MMFNNPAMEDTLTTLACGRRRGKRAEQTSRVPVKLVLSVMVASSIGGATANDQQVKSHFDDTCNKSK